MFPDGGSGVMRKMYRNSDGQYVEELEEDEVSMEGCTRPPP